MAIGAQHAEDGNGIVRLAQPAVGMRVGRQFADFQTSQPLHLVKQVDGDVEQHAALARVIAPRPMLPQRRDALEHYRT